MNREPENDAKQELDKTCSPIHHSSFIIHHSSSILLKIFMGCPLTSEIKMRLQQSPEWQRMRTAGDQQQGRLMQTHFQGKDYLGRFLSLPFPTPADLRKEEKEICSLIDGYCSELENPLQPLVVFPQLFLS